VIVPLPPLPFSAHARRGNTVDWALALLTAPIWVPLLVWTQLERALSKRQQR